MRYYIAHVKLKVGDDDSYMIEAFQMREDSVYTPREKWNTMNKISQALAGQSPRITEIKIFQTSEAICKFLQENKSTLI